jgi:hypothetical protein
VVFLLDKTVNALFNGIQTFKTVDYGSLMVEDKPTEALTDRLTTTYVQAKYQNQIKSLLKINHLIN